MDMEYEKEISFAETTYRLSAVINALQSKLVKAEKVIDAFHKGVRRVKSVPMEFSDACEALIKYQDIKYRNVLRIDELEETK